MEETSNPIGDVSPAGENRSADRPTIVMVRRETAIARPFTAEELAEDPAIVGLTYSD